MKQKTRTLWFVRHGERADNIDETWKCTAKRWDDPPLSERGQKQASEVGLALSEERIDYIFCSPFTRCVQTAANILKHQKARHKLFIEPGFSESLNACSSPPGRPTPDEIIGMYPYVDETYEPVFTTLPPETGGDAGCSMRVGSTLKKVLERFPSGNILVVSHGSPIAACHWQLMGKWNYVGQCTLGCITQQANEYHCEYYGSSDHLTDQGKLRGKQSPEKEIETLKYLAQYKIL